MARRIEYAKLLWESLKTPLNASNLNRIETGIDDSVNEINDILNTLDSLKDLNDVRSSSFYTEQYKESFNYEDYLIASASILTRLSDCDRDIAELNRSKLNRSEAETTYMPKAGGTFSGRITTAQAVLNNAIVGAFTDEFIENPNRIVKKQEVDDLSKRIKALEDKLNGTGGIVGDNTFIFDAGSSTSVM